MYGEEIAKKIIEEIIEAAAGRSVPIVSDFVLNAAETAGCISNFMVHNIEIIKGYSGCVDCNMAFRDFKTYPNYKVMLQGAIFLPEDASHTSKGFCYYKGGEDIYYVEPILKKRGFIENIIKFFEPPEYTYKVIKCEWMNDY